MPVNAFLVVAEKATNKYPSATCPSITKVWRWTGREGMGGDNIPLLTRRLPRHHPEEIPLLRRYLDLMLMRALVRFPRVVMTAPPSNIMLIAHFQFLQADDLLAVVVQGFVDAVAGAVAEDFFGD